MTWWSSVLWPKRQTSQIKHICFFFCNDGYPVVVTVRIVSFVINCIDHEVIVSAKFLFLLFSLKKKSSSNNLHKERNGLCCMHTVASKLMTTCNMLVATLSYIRAGNILTCIFWPQYLFIFLIRFDGKDYCPCLGNWAEAI